VSSKDQSTLRQEVIMQELGVERVYVEKISGKDTNRPELKAMMDFVREGDTVIVESISRFARNTKDLLQLVEMLDNKKVVFISKKETIETSTPSSKCMLTVFGDGAKPERDYRKQRQAEGIAITKKEGKDKGRKKIDDPSNWKEVYERWKRRDITANRAMER